jgi:hypothetical protein
MAAMGLAAQLAHQILDAESHDRSGSRRAAVSSHDFQARGSSPQSAFTPPLLPGARELLSSYVPGAEGPADFYRRCGFVETGDTENGEVVIRLDL